MNSSVEKGFMYDKIKWFVDFTCFDRQENDQEACKMVPIYVRSWVEIVELIKNKSVDFAFPIQADAKAALNGKSDETLIRAFVSSGCSMIVNTKICEAESREQLLTSITSQWPILACIILLSGISGVVIWLLEHSVNQGHFPSSFTAGSPEGFWWAVVSLTTVGYGDKTPKSSLGRLFGVIWILVGAIMLSLFTALFTNAMQAALDGTKCKDIDGKEMGVSVINTETQAVAKELNAEIIKFKNLEEMQKNLSQGVVGRVLVDRNTAFHFLDKSGLKRNRQIRLIRNIEYPLDYYLAHVSKEVLPTPSMSPNDTDDSDKELVERKTELAECGPIFKELSVDLVGVAKTTAEEQLIPAELQTADLSDEMEGLFSTGSEMTKFILFCLLGIFGLLIVLGITWEVFTKCNAKVVKRRKDPHQRQGESEMGNLIPLNKKMSMMQNFLDLEERLKDLTTDLQKLKEEFASTIAHMDTARTHRQFDDEVPNKKSSFFSLLNGKSNNTETVL